MSTDVRIHLFGGMRISVAGADVALPGGRARVLIAALVLARGAVVNTSDLKTLLWPTDEPTTAANQLHRLVGQARRLFQPALPARDAGLFITATGHGYRLDPSQLRSDLEEADAAIGVAHRLGESSQWDAAIEHYLIALEILRHPLLGDANLENSTHPSFAAAARTRATVASEALDCARRTGRLVSVLELAEQVAAAMPFEESLQAALIRAMAQAGRRREALSRYADIRNRLVDEVGVDPGPDLRAAHEEILRFGDQRSAAPHSGDLRGATSSRPAQLPAPLPGMTKRPEAQELLDQVAHAGEAGAVLITAIGGMGGIGKTTLAVAWAHSLAARFPDGQLYVNLRGFEASGRVMSPMDALGDLLLSLGAVKVDAHESLEARSARFRSTVADKLLLLLLDNARDAEQVRPLLPHASGCLVIVTSRNQLASLVVHEGARPIQLDRMTDEQAHELLVQRLGVIRVAQDPDAERRIIAAAAGLPLALAIVAARLVTDTGLGLGAVAEELDRPADQLSNLSGWSVGESGEDLASVFTWSYELLDAEAAQFFRNLAVHPGPVLTLQALASITAQGLDDARRLASQLVRASLLERRGADLFVVHDLLREYAGSRLDDRERAGSEARLVGHYVRSTRNAWAVFGRSPVGDLDPLSELSALSPEDFTTPAAAIDWYIRERPVLTAVLHLAVARGWDRAAANIAIDWRPMNQTVDADEDTYPHALSALAAAERTGDVLLRAEIHRDAGPKAARLGDLEAGIHHLEEARDLYAALGDRIGEANTLRNLAVIPGPSYDAGLAWLREAVALVQGEDLHVEQIVKLTLADKLTLAAPQERVTRAGCLEAEQLFAETIPIIRAHGWTYMLPIAAGGLSLVLMRLSRPREALAVAIEGCQVAQSDPTELAFLIVLVAESALACEEREEAARACRDFRSHVDSMGPDALTKMKPGSGDNDPDFDPFLRVERVESALASAPSRQVSSNH